uniref:Uncharacterized protein n=1 Tax=Heterorhabditis bacteriophora TaxID=37862 RepID=A0A1I7WJP8_HETBA
MGCPIRSRHIWSSLGTAQFKQLPTTLFNKQSNYTTTINITF